MNAPTGLLAAPRRWANSPLSTFRFEVRQDFGSVWIDLSGEWDKPQRMASTLKLVIILAISTGFAFLAFMEPAHTQSAAKLKSQEEIVRDQMIDISRQLNVTCTECHKVENFKDGNKNSFRVGKEHIQIVELLRSNGFDGKNGPQATCYMCHRGELRPAYKETMKIVPVKKVEPKENKDLKKE